MSEALDRRRARKIALVTKKADGSELARVEVPPETLRLLSQLLALMARQQTFTLYPEASELTTKQAAEVLGVSRPFLIGLLDKRVIAHRKVGRHRRVLTKDVLAHQEPCDSTAARHSTNSSRPAKTSVATIFKWFHSIASRSCSTPARFFPCLGATYCSRWRRTSSSTRNGRDAYAMNGCEI
ncbi:MAG: helix-turn-helix domain-containing protein [Sphingomonadales bacterium]|nr:helix-turn-helix domain-containing protein [Sphingomonadales bacterium]